MKIISGGQTGVDQAALDAAIVLNIEHGGWCPRGRLSESGPISDAYNLRETESEKYEVRTEKNVIDSDGTLIFVPKIPLTVTDGTSLTIEFAKKNCKPLLIIDLTIQVEVDSILNWIENNKINCLNIAGPRESQAPGINKLCYTILIDLFEFLLKKQEFCSDLLNEEISELSGERMATKQTLLVRQSDD